MLCQRNLILPSQSHPHCRRGALKSLDNEAPPTAGEERAANDGDGTSENEDERWTARTWRHVISALLASSAVTAAAAESDAGGNYNWQVWAGFGNTGAADTETGGDEENGGVASGRGSVAGNNGSGGRGGGNHRRGGGINPIAPNAIGHNDRSGAFNYLQRQQDSMVEAMEEMQVATNATFRRS